MIFTCRLLLLAGLLCPSLKLFAQQGTRPHAHNDYEHRRPLLDAVAAGFRSVEADVHLRDGRLLVGHNTVNRRSPLLKNLYLRPLDSLMNAGSPCNLKPPFFLMIDLKTDGMATLQQLSSELRDFPQWLNGRCPVNIVLSGNVPKAQLLSQAFAGIMIDGRPDDLGKGIDPIRMPWVSDRFSNWGSVDSNGRITAASVGRISTLAARIHAEGKTFRLWAIPDHPAAWRQLMDAGVDLLNTDRLEEMRAFMDSVK